MRLGRPPGYIANGDAFRDALAGRPQTWLAGQVPISASYLNELIAGRKGARHDHALAISAALGVRPGTLFPQLADFRAEIRMFDPAARAVADDDGDPLGVYDIAALRNGLPTTVASGAVRVVGWQFANRSNDWLQATFTDTADQASAPQKPAWTVSVPAGAHVAWHGPTPLFQHGLTLCLSTRAVANGAVNEHGGVGSVFIALSDTDGAT